MTALRRGFFILVSAPVSKKRKRKEKEVFEKRCVSSHSSYGKLFSPCHWCFALIFPLPPKDLQLVR